MVSLADDEKKKNKIWYYILGGGLFLFLGSMFISGGVGTTLWSVYPAATNLNISNKNITGADIISTSDIYLTGQEVYVSTFQVKGFTIYLNTSVSNDITWNINESDEDGYEFPIPLGEKIVIGDTIE